MKLEFNKRYTTISAYAVITFAICFLMIILALKFTTVAGYISEIARVLAPITWGIVIAYILNPIMKGIEKQLKKLTEKKKPRKKLTRSLSVMLSMIVFLAVIVTLLSIILPQVIDSILSIFNNFSIYFNNITDWVYKMLDDYPDILDTVQKQFNNIQPQLIGFVNDMIPKIGDLAIKFKDGAVGFVVGLKDFIIGFIVAIYLLLSKETFLAQIRKTTHAIFPKNFSKSILNIFSHANKTLSGFISGKLLDSLIIGILCFICMRIMNMQFVALISVIVGVTNIIPFFGPFIGAIPSALLLLVAAPKQVIPFVIFILILQQFDGNILGPKILGDSTGLSAFWVMFAIFIGGGLFGFAGMLLGVPVFAVVYALISDLIEYLLRKKNLPSLTEDYMYAEEELVTPNKSSKHKSKESKNAAAKSTDIKSENTIPESKNDENNM